MISEEKFFDELMKDTAEFDAAAGIGSQEQEQQETDKDTYTRAEVDALIAEKIKEVMEGEKNNVNKEEGNRAAAGAAGTDGEGAGEEGGKENG